MLQMQQKSSPEKNSVSVTLTVGSRTRSILGRLTGAVLRPVSELFAPTFAVVVGAVAKKSGLEEMTSQAVFPKQKNFILHNSNGQCPVQKCTYSLFVNWR
jgi:hypothetical protein